MSGVGVMVGLAANAAILGGVAAVPIISGYIAGEGSKAASAAQQGDINKAIKETQGSEAEAQARLDPFAQTGEQALQQQAALSGALGPEAQAQAVQALQQSQGFQAMLQAGNTNILQNASATGGLRGGNTQAALAQFAPQLLQQFMQQQLGNLGGLSSMGQQAATQQGAFGVQGGLAGADLLTQRGQAKAGGILGQANAQANTVNQLGQLGTQYLGLGLRAAGGGF